MKHSEKLQAAIDKDDQKAVYDLLSVRQRRFCEEYVLDFNGAAAAIRAGYASTWADRHASNILKSPAIAYYVDSLTRSKEAKIVSVNPDYVIQRVMEIIGKEGAKDGDKLRGLELLARHLGMFVDRTEISGPDGGAIETRQVEQEAQNFTNLLKQLADRAKKVEPDEVRKPTRVP